MILYQNDNTTNWFYA